MKKFLSLIPALMLTLSLLPMGASAFTWRDYYHVKPNTDRTEAAPYIVEKSDGSHVNLSQEDYDTIRALHKAHMASKEERASANHPTAEHKFSYASNTKYHWLQCPCGCQVNKEAHVNPLDTDDDYCICGYHFSDDADLVTLWLDGCEGLKNFRKDVYEYETKAYTYKEVNEIKRIATRTHDSEATVEIPEDLTLKEGENKIEVKVTSENKKVTKTYTVIVHKEAKK